MGNKAILRGIGLAALAVFSVTCLANAAEYKYRIRKRLCQLEDNCPTEDSSQKPSGYTARINQDPVTGANQSLVSFTISGAQNGDLFNWTLDDANPGSAALSGNGSMSGATKTVSGLNVGSLSDGILTLRVEVYRNDLWGNPATDTATKSTGGAVFVSFGDGFDDATATAAGQPLSSNTVAVSGIVGTLAVTVSGDASAQVSVNGGPCAASGSMGADGTISLCADSPALDTSKIITVSVGSSTAGWKIGTSAASGGGNAISWGWNASGQLGDGTFNQSLVPVDVAGGHAFAQLASGYRHSCGLTASGEAWCWGYGSYGQLGEGDNQDRSSPVPVSGGLVFSRIDAGWYFTCGLTASGDAWCWGYNVNGELGDGTNLAKTVPTPVAGGHSFTDISAGAYHVCGITSGGETYCWGLNDYGQVGDDGTAPHNEPALVVGGHSFGRISAGGYHSCAIDASDNAWCWGRDTSGQLGDDVAQTGVGHPVAVSGGLQYSAVSAGVYHTCALTTGNLAWCWGSNGAGELGNGTTDPAAQPVAVSGGLPMTRISASLNLTCGLGAGGDGLCWGSNTNGELGDGTTDNRLSPTAVSGGHVFSRIEAGSNHVCGIAAGGTPVDTSGPTVSLLSPQPGSVDVAEDANLVITFGENAVKGTGNIVIKKLADGSVLETIPVADARVTIAGKVATINPTGLFASNTAYYVEVSAGAFKDAADNAFAGISGSGTWAFTSEVTDFAPPLVSTLAPADGAADVAVNANLSITFDEPVMKGSGNIVIRKSSDNTAFETIPVSDARVSVSGNAATINPSGTFAGSTGYYVEVAAGAFRDASANAFAGITGSGTWAFTSADSVPPAVSTLSPANGAAGVAADANLVITFGETVVKGTGNIVIRKSSDNSAVETIPVSDARVSVLGSAATINPAGSFENGTGYYVEVAAGAFRDAAGNAFAGITGGSTWAFTSGVADGTPPSVSLLSPSDGATNAATGLSLSITFSENVVKGTGDIVLKKSSDNSVVETIPVTDARVSIAGAVATINPDVILDANTGYYVEVAAGAFKDAADNSYAGIANATDWNFTTAPLASYMMCSEPDNSWQLLHNFSSGATPTLRWNAAQANNGTQNGVTKYSPSVYNFPYNVYAAMSGGGWSSAGYLQITMPAGGNEFLLCYGNNHSSGTVHIARNVYSNILDSHSTYVVAKLYQGTYTPGDRIIVWEDSAQTLSYWMFIRNSGSPTIQMLSPANGSASAAGDADLVITFSENVAKGSGNIVIRKISDNSVVETIPVSDAKVSVAGALATINPAATLDPETGYYVEAAAGTFEDASGNDFAGLYGSTHWNFTTGAASGTGNLWCWGENSNGTLGDGTTTQRTTPVAVTGMDSDVMAFDGGTSFTCAIQSGALKCWGANGINGKLGNGTTTSSSTPVAVSGMDSGVEAVSTGYYHACAIQSGALRCWGNNGHGQLGDGTTTGSLTPVAVSGMDSGVTAVAAGGEHTCAIQSGAVKCWGSNDFGQLGDGTTTGSLTPVAVSGMDSGVTAVAVGDNHACAIQNGALKCWGYNGHGQSGNGTVTASNLIPVAVTGMDSGVTAVAADAVGYHTCALQSGAVKCWGKNDNGQLGDGTVSSRSAPVAVIGMGSGVTAVAAGWYHSCASQGGVLKCWGINNYGQLGNGTTSGANGVNPTPVAVSGMGAGVMAVAGGYWHTCAMK